MSFSRKIAYTAHGTEQRKTLKTKQILPPPTYQLHFLTQGSKNTSPAAVNIHLDSNTASLVRSLQKWENAVAPPCEIMGQQPKAAQVLLNSQGI